MSSITLERLSRHHDSFIIKLLSNQQVMASITGKAHSKSEIEQHIWPKLLKRQSPVNDFFHAHPPQQAKHCPMAIWIIYSQSTPCGWLQLQRSWLHPKNPFAVTIGYRLLPAFWGKNLASSALKQWYTEIFEPSSRVELYAHTLASNQASQSVLKKCQFTPVHSFCYTERVLPNIDQQHREALLFKKTE